MTDPNLTENPDQEFTLPEGTAFANGHVYKIHFDAQVERPSDEQISALLAPIGAVRVSHAAEGGKNVVIRYNN